MIKYIDAHTHLSDEAYDDDLDLVMARIIENNIVCVNSICDSFEAIEKNLLLKKRFPDLLDLSVGLHPASLKDYTEADYQKIKEAIFDERFVCVGEIGLDYHWHKDNVLEQKEVFVEQIYMANSVKKPIMLHIREAYNDAYEILKLHRPESGCILHCYSGSLEMAFKFLDLGCYLSFGGSLTFKNNKKGIEVVKECPLERLFSETDAPYLSPEPFRGKRNEVSRVIYVVNKIAEVKNLSIELVAKQLLINYNNVFRRS